MTRLRELMIEELRPATSPRQLSVPMSMVSSTSASTSIAVPISLARNIFASTRQCCSAS